MKWAWDLNAENLAAKSDQATQQEGMSVGLREILAVAVYAVYAFPAAFLRVPLCSSPHGWCLSPALVPECALCIGQLSKRLLHFLLQPNRGSLLTRQHLQGRLSCTLDEQGHAKSSRPRALLEVIHCMSCASVQTCTLSDQLKVSQ